MKQKVKCPKCNQKLSEMPNHGIVDFFKNYCDNCEEFVQISATRQKQMLKNE